MQNIARLFKQFSFNYNHVNVLFIMHLCIGSLVFINQKENYFKKSLETFTFKHPARATTNLNENTKQSK